MPVGMKYSNTARKWVSKITERALDYDDYANLAGAMLVTYWRMYPDRYAAFCEAEQPDYRLSFIQCVMLRALCRDKEVDITGGRGITKSYVGLMSRMILGILYP